MSVAFSKTWLAPLWKLFIEIWWIGEKIHQWCQRGEVSNRETFWPMPRCLDPTLCPAESLIWSQPCAESLLLGGDDIFKIDKDRRKRITKKNIWKSEKERLIVKIEINGAYKTLLKYKLHTIKCTHLKCKEFWHIYALSATFWREYN